jgi:hypothetical protein
MSARNGCRLSVVCLSFAMFLPAELAQAAQSAEIPAEGKGDLGNLAERSMHGSQDGGFTGEYVKRGFYWQLGLTGVSGIVSATVEAGDDFPEITGTEKLGVGSGFSAQIGYDLTHWIGVRVNGGLLMVQGGRSDQIRDLVVAYGGAELLGMLAVSERLNFRFGIGGMYVFADNLIETPTKGVGVSGRGGIEYFTRLRHFSIGVDLEVLFPLQPVRLFVALVPTLKYTF